MQLAVEPRLPVAARRSNRPEPITVLETRVVTGSGGGPDKTILNSPRFLVAAGYRTLCAYMHPPGDPGFEQLKVRAAQWQAPLLSIHDRGPWDWQVVTQLLHICRRERVAIWHGHDYKSNALGLLVRRFWPMKLVTTVHGWGVQATRRSPLYYRIDRACLPWYGLVIAVSDNLHEQCLACGVLPDRCFLIPNAIDIVQFSRRQTLEAAKSALGIPPDRLVIGAVGRLSGEKGFDLLIRAVDRLLQSGHDLELVIVGEGDQRPRLESLIKELDRGTRIRLLGYHSDTQAIYEAMDAYALSSFNEGLPNVVLEAMAMEVPVVATRIAGVPRLVQDGANGILIEPRSLEGLTEALARLLNDAALRARLRAAGRQTVEMHYSFEARMQRIRVLYDQLLGRT